MKKTFKPVLTIALLVLGTFSIAGAIGTLTPSGTPGDNTQYSLNDIYNKITNINATPGTKTAPDFDNIAASFRTLSEIWGLLETEKVKVIPENIKDGVTLFGVSGELEGAVALEWSANQGSMNWSTATLACSTLTEGSVPAGTWRLPTIHELGAAIEDDWSDGTGDLFLNLTAYWAGTTADGDLAWSAYWGFGSLTTEPDYNTTGYSVRCVR